MATTEAEESVYETIVDAVQDKVNGDDAIYDTVNGDGAIYDTVIEKAEVRTLDLIVYVNFEFAMLIPLRTINREMS